MIRETVMFGRAIAGETIETLYNEHLRVDIDGANVRQDWYPKISGPPFNSRTPGATRDLTAARKSFHTSSAEARRTFSSTAFTRNGLTTTAAIPCGGRTLSDS